MVPSDESAATALSAALAELYAVPPDEFVATRTRLVQEAKAAGDGALAKALGRARRPTLAAWAVNVVVREQPEQARRLQELGYRLRSAQAQLDVAAMTELRKERDHLLGTWADDADAAGRRSGRPLSPAAGEEVRGTLIAALADEEATHAVLSGQLTRALRYSGFGEVDLTEAVVRTSSGAVLTVLPGEAPSRRTKPEKKAKPQKKAEPQAETEAEPDAELDAELDAEDEARAAERRRRVDEAREAHVAAGEAAREAALVLDQARDRADETRWRVEDLEAQLRQARGEHRDAEQAATDAARARRAAEVEVAKAERALRAAEAGRD